MLNSSQIITIITLLVTPMLFQNWENQNVDLNILSTTYSSDELRILAFKVESDSLVSGSLVPKGPPINPPVRVEAGNNCIVDLVQTYSLTGSLSGTFEIDYRILVYGPCGVPPGTYSEEWIAHGRFEGTINETPASGKFTYTALSKTGGEVDGRMVFDQGINGILEIKGNFNDRKLLYDGWMD